ncbi:hypothetical protein SAMN05660772_02827 [Pasteurella testudinis DSM 23072]|uniref:Uncharacterized protein n=1 Tax=Pasteurella testudinis DSM 23072 TaxID=1122938 RepID=A0A1W1V536_9PAST|nr:hypothetical protein [Pasteurella testudinis]SMB88547.1 hypothetical protein SAMN05660772_02827 [Pasteurella testudinis DSM 23072]SUB51602.1 Uncharacterised protein [Pasteurella testudinis]
MQCAVESDFAAHDRQQCWAAAEDEAIKKWAEKLYETYSSRAVLNPYPWLVGSVECALCERDDFWESIQDSNWVKLEEIKKEVIELLAEKHWEDEQY